MAHSNVYYLDTSCPSDMKCENVDEKTCTKLSVPGAATLDAMPESVKKKVKTVSPSLHDVECAHGKLPVDTLAIEYHDETAVDDCTRKIHTDVCEPPMMSVET